MNQSASAILHFFKKRQARVFPAAALLVVPLFFLIGCGKSQSSAAAGPPQMPPPVVTTAIVQVKTVPAYGDFVGQTSAIDTVNILPRVTGFLEKIYFKEGSAVHKGDTLFRIEQASYINSVESADAKLAQDRAQLIKYQRDAARLEPLTLQHAATQTDLDTAVSGAAQQEAAMKADQASIDGAKLNLSYTTIKSPIDGVIGKLGVTTGNLVSSGQTTVLATISSINPIYVYFSVPEATYLLFRRKSENETATPTMQLSLVLADNKPFQYKGKFNFADPLVDSQTGTLSVRAIFPNPHGLLRPGEFARIRFITEERANAVLVPKGSVTDVLNSKAVMVLDASNKVQQRTVTLDGEHEGDFIVHSGLSGGERIVVEGIQKVHPGMQVNPKPSTTESAN